MSEKRRDNKGRVLHSGEYQRKDGRYAYKYKDLSGKTKYLYSSRLDKRDRISGCYTHLTFDDAKKDMKKVLAECLTP